MAYTTDGKYFCKARTGEDVDFPVLLQSVLPLRTKKKCSAQNCQTPCLYHPNYYWWEGNLPKGLIEPASDYFQPNKGEEI